METNLKITFDLTPLTSCFFPLELLVLSLVSLSDDVYLYLSKPKDGLFESMWSSSSFKFSEKQNNKQN